MSLKEEYLKFYQKNNDDSNNMIHPIDYIETPEKEYTLADFKEKESDREEMFNAIDYIVENFDYEAVHDTMEMLNWHWAKYNRVPTIPELKEELLTLLCELLEEECNVISTGGFNVSYEIYSYDDDDTKTFDNFVHITAQFVVTEIES